MMNQQNLILSANRSLLGEITSNFRYVSVCQRTNGIKLRVIFFKKPSDEEIDSVGFIGTEILSNFDENEKLFDEIEVNSDSNIYIASDELSVYRRKDDF